MANSKQKQKRQESMKPDAPDMSFRKIMKDIELFSSSHMTFKERKELENKKVVALGGKPPKKQRLPLSVARVQMKKQKEREQKMMEENMILGRFGAKLLGKSKKPAEKRRPEDMVLKASEGHFRNGVLDVKHLLHSGSARDAKRGSNSEVNTMMRMKKGKTKKGKGKKQGGNKRR